MNKPCLGAFDCAMDRLVSWIESGAAKRLLVTPLLYAAIITRYAYNIIKDK